MADEGKVFKAVVELLTTTDPAAKIFTSRVSLLSKTTNPSAKIFKLYVQQLSKISYEVRIFTSRVELLSKITTGASARIYKAYVQVLSKVPAITELLVATQENIYLQEYVTFEINPIKRYPRPSTRNASHVYAMF